MAQGYIGVDHRFVLLAVLLSFSLPAPSCQLEGGFEG
jgi:hypothetical protein